MFNGFTVSGASLPLLNIGERGIIARLTSADADTVRELRSLGFDRGASIRMVQRSPHCVVSTGGKQVTLSKRLSRAIYVRTKSSVR